MSNSGTNPTPPPQRLDWSVAEPAITELARQFVDVAGPHWNLGNDRGGLALMTFMAEVERSGLPVPSIIQ